MKTVTEHLRERLLRRAGLWEYRALPPLESLQQSEWSHRFERYMRNRLILGAFRYGLLEREDKLANDNVDSIGQRLREYHVDGNLEHLVDIANLCMVEYVGREREGLELRPIDDGHHVAMRQL